MRALAALAAVLVAAAALFAGAAEGNLVVEASLEQKSVKLGEDAVLSVTLTNHTATAMSVPALRIARDSLSVRVTGTGMAPAIVTRLYGSFLEDETGGLELRPEATPRRQLGAGEALTGRIVVPAVFSGLLTLTVVVADGTPLRAESKPVVLEVIGRQRVAAQVETTMGGFRIDLDAANSYAAVANFWTLAKDGFFDGLAFHRVVAGVLAQTGDPRGTGSGGPGWYVPGSAPVGASTRGDVGFARGAHPDSAGSQWFVVVDSKNALAGGYVRLGTIGEGIDVADLLASNAPAPKSVKPRTPDRVTSVKTLLR